MIDGGQRIFITGGASGLGRAIAMHYARSGYRVCIGDLNKARGAEVETELKSLAPDACFTVCDVSRVEQLERVRDMLVERWGGVDVVVNNAGVGGSAGPIEEVTPAHWQTTVDVNLMGVIWGCKAFTPLFKQQGAGHFINIASGGGYINAPYLSSYSVTKAGVISLSETLLAEFHGDNIGVTLVCPGFFHSNLTESMHSHFDGLEAKVNTMMSESKVTAEHVAQKIYRAQKKQQFLLLPHRAERYLWYLKRLSPRGFSALMKRYGRQLFN